MKSVFSQKSNRVILHIPRKTDKGKEKSFLSLDFEGSRTISAGTLQKSNNPEVIWGPDLELQQTAQKYCSIPLIFSNLYKISNSSYYYQQRENKMLRLFLARDHKMAGKPVIRAVI